MFCDSLSPEARTLVTEAVSHLEKGYDPTSGIVTETMEGKPYRSVRNTLYYALGLLILHEQEALPTAVRAISAVLDLQFDDPAEVFHGTFRHPDDEMPPRGLFPYRDVTPYVRYMADVAWEHIGAEFDHALRDDPRFAGQSADLADLLHRALCRAVPVAWDTYEPNLREFTGMIFAMVLVHFQSILPTELTERILSASERACTGMVTRLDAALTPLNTNVRIMAIFLLDHFGKRLRREDWKARALEEMRALLGEYREFGACAEFNSPTYCGVDLSTLGFFRRYGSAPELVRSADELEEHLWRDVADFYNPSMRAFSGPYSRCYELDMSVHTCFYDILYLGLGRELWPDHPFSIESVVNPLTVLGDIRIPEDVRPLFLHERPPFTVTRRFRELAERGDPRVPQAVCTATAYVTPDFMAGAMSGSRNPSHQLHPFVVFWKNGTIKLLRSLMDGSMNHLHTVLFDGQVRGTHAEMTVRSETPFPVLVFYEIEAKEELRGDMVTSSSWDLPGLHVDVDGPVPEVQAYGGNVLRLAFPLHEGETLAFRFDFAPVS